jgi:hypothetical protein
MQRAGAVEHDTIPTAGRQHRQATERQGDQSSLREDSD